MHGRHLLAGRLTDRAGASDFFAGGVVAYSNEAKTELLDVPGPDRRARCRLEQVAEALADGAVERFGADIGMGVTGIAGPDGGTEGKPVGYVCVVAHIGGDVRRVTRAIEIPGSRADIRDRSTTVALHLLRRLLLEEDIPE